jgi:hypothetical protein
VTLRFFNFCKTLATLQPQAFRQIETFRRRLDGGRGDVGGCQRLSIHCPCKIPVTSVIGYNVYQYCIDVSPPGGDVLVCELPVNLLMSSGAGCADARGGGGDPVSRLLILAGVFLVLSLVALLFMVLLLLGMIL